MSKLNLIHGDCMEGMKEMEDNQFDLAIVDPPYGIGDFSVARSERKPFNRKWNIEWNDNTPGKKYFNELRRVSKNHIIFGFQFYSKYLWDELQGVIIHDFKGGGFQSHADVAVTNLQKRVTMFKYSWHGFINGNQKENDNNRIHPCEKPQSLYEWLLKNYAKEGDTILDTHGGSFSIAIACHDMGFDLTGYEIDEDYYNAGVKRVNQHIAQGSLFKPKEIISEPKQLSIDDQ